MKRSATLITNDGRRKQYDGTNSNRSNGTGSSNKNVQVVTSRFFNSNDKIVAKSSDQIREFCFAPMGSSDACDITATDYEENRTSTDTGSTSISNKTKPDRLLRFSWNSIESGSVKMPTFRERSLRNTLDTSKDLNASATDFGKIINAEQQQVYIKPNIIDTIKHTPLEKQVLELKERYPDCILFVECGYKFRFFDKDAEIASAVLNIQCSRDHNFLTASVPTHRLYVHVRRLVHKGYKVGVVRQTETAALKAAATDNKSTVFRRELTAMYTKSTLIGEDVDGSVQDTAADNNTQSFLMCLYVYPTGRSRSINLAFMCVDVSSGEVVYDDFLDDPTTFNGLNTRLTHINPAEILLPSTADHVDDIIAHIISNSTRREDCTRIERVSDQWYEDTWCLPSDECADLLPPLRDLPSTVYHLPPATRCCLAALRQYLHHFGLHRVINASSELHRFSGSSNVLKLCGETVSNLHLLPSNSAPSHSLYQLLAQHCSWPTVGARMMKKWILQPLVFASDIEQRQDAVSECWRMLTARGDGVPWLHEWRRVVSGAPDLAHSLCCVLHGRCSTARYYSALSALRAGRAAAVAGHEAVSSPLLRHLLSLITDNLRGVAQYLDMLNEGAARAGHVAQVFRELHRFPVLRDRKADIQTLEQRMTDYATEIARTLNVNSIQYKTISGCEYLVEVAHSQLALVPSDWRKISATKRATRFHPPYIITAYGTLQQHREQLDVDARRAWETMLQDVSCHIPLYQSAVKAMAQVDCILALANLAATSPATYCCPVIVNPDDDKASSSSREIDIANGRHPILDHMTTSPYVPNSTKLDSSQVRCMLLTGPNMGGKSSYMRQVALIVIMAQIGSYVPADSVRLTPVDAIYTRMGGWDEGARSTFMVELSSVGEMLSRATPRSLLILDELGRGTSTHDGTAIAYATLRYIATQLECLCIFVTHYLPLSSLQRLYPRHVANYRMRYEIVEQSARPVDAAAATGAEDVVFLYQLSADADPAEEEERPRCRPFSYGLHVATLANMPTRVLARAAARARSMERAVNQHRQKVQDVSLVLSADVTNIKSRLKSIQLGNVPQLGHSK